MQQPRLRTHAQAVGLRLVPSLSTQRIAAAQMARDHFQIIVAKNLADATADESVTRSVKSPAFRFVLVLPFERHRVGTNLGRDRFVKACLQSRD